MRISVGIVLYNPNVNRLEENISTIITQCEHVYLVDNGSDNLSEIEKLLNVHNCSKFTLILNVRNEGIAYALNQLCEVSNTNGYDWVLTLDQDSICPSNIIEEYYKNAYKEKVGMFCPLVLERNSGNTLLTQEKNIFDVNECITSGSMIRIAIWKKLNGFDESMFIDGVDFDMCHRIIKAGYQIQCISKIILTHELGNTTVRRFLFWKIKVKNHSSFRKYYIARNTMYLARKEKTSLGKALLQNTKLMLINWGYETGKVEKSKKIIKGTVDGLYCRVNKSI